MYHQSWRAIANGDRVKHHRLVVQPVGTACDWSNYWSCDCLTHNHERLVVRPRTNRGAITRDWWYNHVRHACVLWSQTDRRQFWTWPSTDFARTIMYDHPRPLRSVSRSLYDLTVIPTFFDGRRFGVTVAIVHMKKVYNLEQKMNHNWQ